VHHQHVDELGEFDITEFRVGQNFAFGYFATTWHFISSEFLAGLRSLRALRAVLRTALFAILDTLRVEAAAHDVITHAGQILDPAAANQHHRVFLQVVAFAADVADDFEAGGQTHLGDFTQRRVRL